MTDYNKICLSCMSGEIDEYGNCPVCGGRNDSIKLPGRSLPLYSVLRGRYMTGRALGEGGFGITYIGLDLNLERVVAIKEYCPREFAARDTRTGRTLVPYDVETRGFYQNEMNKFIDEARILAKFRGIPGIVPVLDYFQENATAYIVMEYINGTTLKQILKNNGTPMQVDFAINLIHPIINSLQRVHKEGVIHRDISPDNIMVSKDFKSVYLIDFGTARSVSESEEHSLSVYKKSGYTPPEQQNRHGNQGPWTDVYEMCATIYFMITLKSVPEAVERLMGDKLILPSDLGVKLSQGVQDAIIKGLNVKLEDRIKDMNELESALYTPKDTAEARGTSNVSSSNRISNNPPVPEKNEVITAAPSDDKAQNKSSENKQNAHELEIDRSIDNLNKLNEKIKSNEEQNRNYSSSVSRNDTSKNSKAFTWLFLTIIIGLIILVASAIDHNMNTSSSKNTTKVSSSSSTTTTEQVKEGRFDTSDGYEIYKNGKVVERGSTKEKWIETIEYTSNGTKEDRSYTDGSGRRTSLERYNDGNYHATIYENGDLIGEKENDKWIYRYDDEGIKYIYDNGKQSEAIKPDGTHIYFENGSNRWEIPVNSILDKSICKIAGISDDAVEITNYDPINKTWSNDYTVRGVSNSELEEYMRQAFSKKRRENGLDGLYQDQELDAYARKVCEKVKHGDNAEIQKAFNNTSISKKVWACWNYNERPFYLVEPTAKDFSAINNFMKRYNCFGCCVYKTPDGKWIYFAVMYY